MADLREARGMSVPLGVQILSISCSLWENLATSYVGRPAPFGGLAPPSLEIPGSATVDISFLEYSTDTSHR